MSFRTILSHRAVRQVLVAHVATVLIVMAVVVNPPAIAGWGTLVRPPWLPGAVVGLAALGGAGWMLWRLQAVLVWDRRLAALDAATPRSTAIDPFLLTTASGSSAAEFGWNRLVEQGRYWQALVEAEEALRARLTEGQTGDAGPLLDAINDGVAAVDSTGVITYANAAMAGICGSESPRELIGKSLMSALRVETPSGDQSPATGNCSADIGEWIVPSSSGSRTLRGVRRAVSDERRETDATRREPLRFVWTIRDVTQQQLAEAMREKFLSAATHEFRTPLANIRAYAESLDLGHDIDAEERKRFYNVIQSESLRLSQLVDDLLDISRMQAGAMSLDRRETDLGRLVEEVAAKVQAQMRDKQLLFRCELPPKFPKIVADKGQLTAALVNLLGNAAKYTPEGGKVTFRVDVGAQLVQFSVTDTGIGIAPDELPHLFERFFRGNDERVREVSGSGLGLALAQEIARLHGGEIVVESVFNQGSTFHLSIPLDPTI